MLRSDEGLAETELQVSSNSDADRGDGPQTPNPDATAAPLCRTCATWKAQRDGLCSACRLTALNVARASVVIPPTLIKELRLAYAGNSKAVSANLDRIAQRTGIPRRRLRSFAYHQGFRATGQRRQWTAEEIEYLGENLGSVSVRYMARKLGRSASAVKHKASELQRSARLTSGYNISNLCDVFGVSDERVKRWIGRGLLGKAHGGAGRGCETRITEENVIRFIKLYPSEYDLGRVEQAWYKALVFGRV